MNRAIRAGLRWLSEQARWSVLHTSAESTTTSGTQYVDYPANYRLPDKITVNDGTYESKALSRITFAKWCFNREDETSGDYDEPENYAIRRRRFYLDPIPDDNGGSNYTVTIWYWRYHPDQTSILFGEDFEQAVNYAVIAAYLEGKGRHSKAQYYRALAATEVALLRPGHSDKIERFTKYRDMG